jgi:iron-sulfur cluster assembly protein
MIHLSQAAAQEVQRMRSKAANPNALFRLGIQPGGCAEFYYTLELIDSASPDEQMFHCEGIPIVVVSQSWPYLTGLNLDYSEDLMGGGFRFHNPNATSSCGCGNSFAITHSEHSA